jgi:PAS domain S-box-containing protein/putative nucleotidyltransferase with HDIG domain
MKEGNSGEEAYRDLFENARDVIVILDLKGNVAAVNRAAEEYGFRREELLGKNMLDFVPERYRPRLLEELARISQGEPIAGEIELFTPKGPKLAEYRSNPIRRAGKVVGLQTILRDITERKRLERGLAAIHTLSRRLVLSRSEEEIVQAAVEAAKEVLGLEDCGLFLVDEKAERLFCAAHTLGEPPGPKEFPLASERGIIPAVARFGETILLPDVTEEPRFVGGRLPNRSELCVPLKAGAQVLGVLNAESQELNAFTPEDRQLLEALANATAVALENLRLFTTLQESYERLERLLEQMVDVLAATVEVRDPYTAGHQRRVAQLACAIAREMGLPEDLIEGLRMAAQIHDIGKIYTPAEILSRPGRLNPPELELVRTHPQAGYEILRKIDFPWPVAEIVRQHHERLDGSGYPQGLKGEEIRLEARIMAVADVVEAMASHRPYRPAHTIEEALEEIARYKGQLYDPPSC